MIAAGRNAGENTTLEARIRDEGERMKRVFESLGLPLTDALKERAKAVENMIKDHRLEPALKAMEQLAKDSGLDEPARKGNPDFTKLKSGDTDPAILGQRLEAVQDKVRHVISVHVLRQLMQAREALDQAKDNSDAEAVGRILTFAEGLLEKK
jgi:hypothetical protein